MIVVDMLDGSKYNVKRLLTKPATPNIEAIKATLESGNYPPKREAWLRWALGRGGTGGNSKLIKGQKVDFTSIGLSLAPNSESGHSVCPFTTPGCTRACIFNGGVSEAMKQVKPSQIAKTRALFQAPAEFDRMLDVELAEFRRKHENLVCRLNVYSDLPWERMRPWVFTRYESVQFYDYTKVPARMFHFLAGQFPKNYHLTFSRSEMNESTCQKVLDAGGNVAVVFPVHSFPETYLGHKVIIGDDNDLRFLDEGPVIIGLKAKNKFGRSDTTGFVVRPTA